MTPLLMDIDPTLLSAFHLDRIEMIDAEDFSGVKRKVREELHKQGHVNIPDDYLDRGVRALKVYYALALVDPLNEHAVSEEIDLFWHAHIIHTKQYRAFCDRIFGEYVDHEPLDHEIPADVADISRLYAHSMVIYGAFLVSPDDIFFPKTVPDSLLVCRHMALNSAEIKQHAAFAPGLLVA